MVRECCVCRNTRQDAILYRFPSAAERFHLWLRIINRNDLRGLSAEQYLHFYVCEQHFERKFISPKALGSRSRLLQKAYPSLFTVEEISSGKPSQEIHNAERSLHTDHSYSRKRHFDHTYSHEEPLKVLDVRTPIKIKKLCKKQLVRRVKNLTPCCKSIYKECLKAKNQTDFFRRAKRSLKFSNDTSFENLTKNINPYAKNFTKSKKGRRFTAEEKMIALSIMKQSPKCYRFLHKIFILPNKNVEPGYPRSERTEKILK